MALKTSKFSHRQLIIFSLVFAIIGGIIIYRSFAAGVLGSSLPPRLPQSSGAGGTFYVDGTNGNDVNSGSSTSPWKTINKALNAVPLSGSIIRVKPGTYYSSPGNYVINFARAGNINDPVTLRADQPGTVNIQNSDPSGWTIGAWIHGGATGLRIQDLTFKMLNNVGAGGSTDIQIEASDNVEFYNNTFNEVSGIGFICKGGYLATSDTSDNIWVLNNSFRPSGTNAYAQVTGLGSANNTYFGSKGSHWMYLGQFGSNPDPAKGETWDHTNGCNKMVVTNNTFVGAAAGRDIQLGPELRNSFITNNTFFGNKSVQTIGYGDPANDASAVYAGQGVVFFNNTGNTQYSTGNNVVTNNIFMNLFGHAVSGSGSTMAGNLVQNNLSFGLDNGVYNGTAWDGDASLDYMYYYGTTANNLFSTGSGNQPKSDPLFVNPMGFDYHLKSGSPATAKADPAYAYPTDKDGLARSTTPSLGAYDITGTVSSPTSNFYSSTSPWNTQLPATPIIYSGSAAMVQSMTDQANSSTGFTIASGSYSIPIFFANASTPKYDMTITTYNPGVMRGVPIPAGAKADTGTDHHLMIIDTSTNIEYDFFNVTNGDISLHEAKGGVTTSSIGSGVISSGFASMRGSGFALGGGVIRPDELAAGQINHALGLITSNNSPQIWPPATESDGSHNLASSVPMGARVQLDPSFNVDAQAWASWQKTIAKALQKYGMIVFDSTTGGMSLQAQNPNSFASPSYPWGTTSYPDMKWLPISSFRVLDPNQSTTPTYTVSESIISNSVLSGNVSWEATPVGNTTSKVDFYIDGSLKWSEGIAPYIYNGDGATLDTKTLTNGSHVFKVIATASDNTTAQTSVTATINNTASSIPGDLSGDGHVTITDLSILLTNYGSNNTTADIDKSGKVDITDLSILLSHYGT